jgi:hypothetical protein
LEGKFVLHIKYRRRAPGFTEFAQRPIPHQSHHPWNESHQQKPTQSAGF